MKQVRPTEYDENGSIKRSGMSDSEESSSRLHGVGVFEEVIAPDGTRIANRAQMQDFERRSGMTNDLDSLRGQTAREMERARGQKSTGTKKDRVAALRDAIERTSSSGFSRREQYE